MQVSPNNHLRLKKMKQRRVLLEKRKYYQELNYGNIYQFYVIRVYLRLEMTFHNLMSPLAMHFASQLQ